MSEQTFLTLFALALYAFSAIFFSAGYYLRSKTRRILDSAVVTKGTIVALEPWVSMSSGSIYKVFRVFFTFSDTQGVEHRVQASSCANPGDCGVGDVIDVFYDPRLPQKAITDPKTSFQMARICLGAAIAAAIVATAMILLPKFL
jgi:hypothetical protein